MTLLKDSNGLIDLNQASIAYNSSNGLHLQLALTQNVIKYSNNLREKISFYTFIASTTATIAMIINFYLIKLLTQAESNIKAISITFISLNAIWNLHSFIINFAFAIKFNEHFFQFIIPSFLYLCLFLLVDLQLLYYYFVIRRKTLSDGDVKRRLIAFGILALIGLGIVLLFFYAFYFEKNGLLFVLITLWLPLIIHNVIWNNNTALPIAYTSLATLTKMSMPLYFRGYANNCFSIEPDGVFIVKCIIIEVCLLLCIGSQSLLGARWFLPKCLRKNMKEEIYFYSEKDAMELFQNYIDEECVICLNKLFNHAIPLSDINKDSHSGSGEIDIPSIYSRINNPNANDTMGVNSKEKDFSSSIIVEPKERLSLEIITSVVVSSLLDFHEWKFKQRKNNLPYMITQCNHLFHAQCLELWLRQVKKCPSCRKVITIIPI